MQYRQLGNSGLKVSALSLGSWLTYGNQTDKLVAFECVDKALELGVNYLDTADVYNRGEAEKVIGEYLRTKSRHELVIGTKLFGPMSDSWMAQGLSLRHVRNACEASLQRLKTDYIDLYQCHRYDADTPLEETCYAMHNLIERGYILHWGVSQWSAIQILQAIRVCEKHGWRKPISNQPIYNLINRSLEVDVMEICATEKLGILVYSPLAQGLLTGKYTRDHTPEDSRLANEATAGFFPTKRMTDNYFEQQDKLKELASGLGTGISGLALAWILKKPEITSVIMGASRPSQVAENIKALEVELDESSMEEIEAIMGNAPVDQYSGARTGYGVIKAGY